MAAKRKADATAREIKADRAARITRLQIALYGVYQFDDMSDILTAALADIQASADEFELDYEELLLCSRSWFTTEDK